jgi:phytoene dehydrogenase-like protein
MKGYDVIVIGAGNGGLTAAATLAKAGVSVLLLERHNIPGGCATSFCRGRFEFETALHQLSGVGTPGNPGPIRSLLDSIDVLEKVELVEIDELYRTVVLDSLDLSLKADRNQVIDELHRRFPKEKQNIDEFFDLLYRFFSEIVGAFYMKDPNVSREKYPLYFKYALMNSQDVLEEFFDDPLLMWTISTYWPFLGLPPRKLAFSNLALMLVAYIEFKPFHIRGGSQALSNAIADTVISNGGVIRYNCPVKRILIDNGGVKGIITGDGEEIPARFVISNASKITTYFEMIDADHLPDESFNEMRGSILGPSAFTIYMGLDCKPEELGVSVATTFVSPDIDADKHFELYRTIEFNDDPIGFTCYNLIDPDFAPEGATQAVLITLKYADPWLKIPPERYAHEKIRVANAMIDMGERVYPGLRRHIEELEIATPITHMRYLGHPGGAIYGFEQHAKDSILFVSPKPPVEGLYLAGAWADMGGFQPTMESGTKAARAVLRELRA